MKKCAPTGFGSSIPVLGMLSEEESRRFYLEYLGYEVVWEHRFSPDDSGSPLYMQVRRGDSVLHLNGHSNEGHPTAEVRVPVGDVVALEKELANRQGSRPKAEAVDPRYEGRKTEMNIYDPAGNLLTFWQEEENS